MSLTHIPAPISIDTGLINKNSLFLRRLFFENRTNFRKMRCSGLPQLLLRIPERAVCWTAAGCIPKAD